MSDWKTTIGIECHVQFNTVTKIFSGASNDADDEAPNSAVSPICFALPGTLPVLNEAVIDKAIRVGLALQAEIAEFSKFDRKHYFYPDLPKGYQITQLDYPTVGKGSIDVPLGDGSFTVGITRAHLEEDAGKSTHPDGAAYSLVDLNRAGTPLIEIVSEPDIHSAAEARAYAEELYALMSYAGVTNGDLFKGNMRFDVNISVSKTSELGTRTEIKNMNSFRAIERATEYEITRQIAELEAGKEIVQQTRGWDEAAQKTFTQRTKEDADDYRYFPEPDVPPLNISKERIEEVKKTMPILPPVIREQLKKAGVPAKNADQLINNKVATQLMLEAIDTPNVDAAASKKVSDWLLSDVTVNEEMRIQASSLVQLAEMTNVGDISSSGAKEVLAALDGNKKNVAEIAEELGLLQNSDEGEIDTIVLDVIAANEAVVEQIRGGKEEAIGFLVGQVMKQSKGSANPALASKLLKKHIG